MKKTYKIEASLSPATLDELSDVFKTQNWNPDNEDRFNRFCELLSRLKNDEQQIIINLTRDFLHLSFVDYPSAISKLAGIITSAIPAGIKEIITVPLIDPKDLGEVKSGCFLAYMLKEEMKPIVRERRIDFSSIDRYSELEKRKGRSNALILFLDDFLGSGNTAVQALKEYATALGENKENKYKSPDDTVLIAALVAQHNAITLLKNNGYDAKCLHLRVRGISDSNRFPDKTKALALIDQIETRLMVRPKFRRGFMQSEALVCLFKCPNNTFPVFWCKKEARGTSWPAPFANK